MVSVCRVSTCFQHASASLVAVALLLPVCLAFASWIFLISFKNSLQQCYSVELSAVIEILGICAAPCGAREPHVAIEHLKYDWYD